jgi:two-component system LytT family response regulator
MVRCLIVDDEPLAQQVLENYIARTPMLELTGKCFHAAEAIALLRREPVDLLFLDIKMPHISGIQLIQSLKHAPAFIFTTAYAEYAVQSYELQATDYLLKPITYERFRKSIDRYLQLQPAPTQEAVKHYLYIKVDGSLVKVFHTDIVFAQSLKDYIRITTTSGTFLTHLTMKSLLELLPEEQFKRIHRSYVVNLQHVNKISKDAVVAGTNTLPVGDMYKENLKR